MNVKTDGNDLVYPFQDMSGLIQPSYGITKREYFAALALQGVMANPHNIPEKSDDHVHKRVARAAILLADSLIEELNKNWRNCE
jgi:hypothetical protein